MSRATYKQHSLGAPPLRAEGGTRWWSMAVVSFVLCAGPTGAQTRVHNPRAPKPAPATEATPASGAQPSPTPETPTAAATPASAAQPGPAPETPAAAATPAESVPPSAEPA